MPWQKQLADALTLSRLPCALAVIALGFSQGRDGLEAAWLLLLLAATIDTLDGYFARLAPGSYQTWIGAHDLFFDLLFSTALLFYLVLAGVIEPYLGALYLAGWGIVTFTTDGAANVRAIAFQGPIYLMTVWAAGDATPRVFVWTALWLAIMALFGGRRFLTVRLPVLLRDLVASVHSGSRRNDKSR